MLMSGVSTFTAGIFWSISGLLDTAIFDFISCSALATSFEASLNAAATFSIVSSCRLSRVTVSGTGRGAAEADGVGSGDSFVATVSLESSEEQSRSWDLSDGLSHDAGSESSRESLLQDE